MKNIEKLAYKYLESNYITITNANLDSFINEKPTVPKALFFIDGKEVPHIVKSLSLNFEVLLQQNKCILK